VSDIDIAVADSLKVLDLKRPIREATELHQRRGAYACSDKSRHLPRVTRAFDQDDAAELL
jgi:hypothetical protein